MLHSLRAKNRSEWLTEIQPTKGRSGAPRSRHQNHSHEQLLLPNNEWSVRIRKSKTKASLQPYIDCRDNNSFPIQAVPQLWNLKSI